MRPAANIAGIKKPRVGLLAAVLTGFLRGRQTPSAVEGWLYYKVEAVADIKAIRVAQGGLVGLGCVRVFTHDGEYYLVRSDLQ